MADLEEKANKKIGSCTCNAVNIIEDLTEFYIARAMQEQESRRVKEQYYSSARKLSEDIVNQLNNRSAFDVKIPDRYDEKLKDAKKYLTLCKDGSKSDCVFSLEMLRQVLHESPHAREKFLCNPNPNVRSGVSRSREMEERRGGAPISPSERSGIIYGKSSRLGDSIQELLRSSNEATFISEGILEKVKWADKSYHPFRRYIPEEYIEGCKEHRKPVTKFLEYIQP